MRLHQELPCTTRRVAQIRSHTGSKCPAVGRPTCTSLGTHRMGVVAV
jgi:hypothetical protein